MDADREADELYRIRHSAAHVMAQAVMERFPGETRIAIGPPIEDGFYYDFELPRPLTPDDLEAIEVRMRAILCEDHPFERRVLPAAEARQIFKDQPYKLELIEGLEKGRFDEHGNPLQEQPEISIYTHGSFVDLCRGPHVANTNQIDPQAVKLMHVSGAYWRGDENRPVLQRIYGTAWRTPEELHAYLWRLEEARKRDHRKLGKELGLFILPEEVGQGLPIWLPKGAQVRKVMEDFLYQNEVERGYLHVVSPHLGKKQLWVTSGHWDLYAEKMYAPMNIDGVDHLVKPMTCPMHMLVYSSQVRSYRDLPIRIAETSAVYRREQSGELTGMLRVRGITQDDAHIFARPDQLQAEFLEVLDLVFYQFAAFGFHDFELWVSVRDQYKKDKYLGDDEQWDHAEQTIKEVLDSRGLAYIVAEGEAKFYGPALDIMIRDALGRKWQCTTIQVDFQLPMRFELEYVDAAGQTQRPVVLHRAPLGSLERFFALLVEHYAGAFPLWLAPVQAQIIPIADRHLEYASQVAGKLKGAGLRVEVDRRSERMNAKIRDAQLQKVPYMLVVGDKELAAGEIAVRLRSGEDLGRMPVEAFIQKARQEIEAKRGSIQS